MTNIESIPLHPPTSTTTPTLVLGGTGKTGRRVAERLRRTGVPVRALGRTTPIPFDWADRGTWDAAISGAKRVYLAYSPDLAVPGAVEAVKEITDRLVATGVERIVLLSGRGEPEAADAEDVVICSGVEWSVVRCSWFFQNFTEGYLRDPLVEGSLFLPAGSVSEPFVDAEDIADVAAAALVDSRHSGELYELTGPELLTFQQIVETVGTHTGRSIEYVPIPAEDYSQAALADGVPADVVTLLDYLFRVVLDGRNASLADGVQRALGREPGSFDAFARRSAAAGSWNAEEQS
ncbi:NmrA family NAD(P)-binding protein [Herbiconiux sp. CPCC 205763]|uniref:NmrA family NAD(P)-binding protein n=1 Tax=Herbiconiux aconitum TaxID=2970913 RepID=A0ABT2GR89_9MICO|nr:NAD(P)H-binding protein [Herbiconiux aconitum]MCS5718737.1 NmrA family NAD(P)-binding protein [Herbiconiux aconitum]